MAFTNITRPIPMTYVNSNTLAADYLPINDGGLPYPCVYIKILNFSDHNIDISYRDGQTQEYIAAWKRAEFNFQANARPGNSVAMLKKGTIIYAKDGGGSGQKGGYIYLVGWYLVKG